MPTELPANVEVRRSTRRRRTVSARMEGDRMILAIPARMSRAEELRWAHEMVARLEAKRAKSRLGTDGDLERRAAELAGRYLPEAPAPTSVRWVTNQNSRWGSCTPADGSIRLSHRLESMPTWVVDYVLIHELTHLLEANHSDRFWALVRRYPKSERAEGFLDGVSHAGSAAAPEPGTPGEQPPLFDA